jgi:hypothetical protein
LIYISTPPPPYVFVMYNIMKKLFKGTVSAKKNSPQIQYLQIKIMSQIQYSTV